jgi:hypothetical protein
VSAQTALNRNCRLHPGANFLGGANLLSKRLGVLILVICAWGGSLWGQGDGRSHGSAPTVIVSLGKPNAWTMDQAHYLLEKNRAHDLGIAVQDLGSLDANEIVGYRLDAVKTLLTAQIQYDAVTGSKNKAAVNQYNTDMLRYNLLRGQQDRLRVEQASLANQLASAQYQLGILQAQTPQDPKKIQPLQAEIGRITGAKAGVDEEMNSLSQSIGQEPTLGSLTSSAPAAEQTSESAIGKNPVFDQMLSGIPQGLNNSKTQASIKLDNYINLQYELVAKQLTLLRDEAGPKNRVIFVELPQSIYVTQKFKYLLPDLPALLGAHVVQTWWRVTDVLTAERREASKKVGQSVRPPTSDELLQVATAMRLRLKHGSDRGGGLKVDDARITEASSKALAAFVGAEPKDAAVNAAEESTCTAEARGQDDLVCTWARNWKFKVVPAQENARNGVPYALDLIPRQSALNVADAHAVSHAYGFAGLFSLLSGLGGRARYERQHDQYDQFVQQEVFASAFGRGEQKFGWTFGPLPGTKRMAPGIRSTYAVIVVPESARILRLEGIGCGYRRRKVPKDPFLVSGDIGEDCSGRVTYDIEVPNGDDSFQVTGVDYRPVQSGQRIVVDLEGSFGAQVGILVNGTPLQKVVAIGQPLAEQGSFTVPSNAGDSGVQGVYELVGRRTVLMSFTMPASFAGTPRISLVSPARTFSINDYPLFVTDGTGKQDPQLIDGALPMFYQTLGIASVTVNYSHSTSKTSIKGEKPSMLLNLLGQGFQPPDSGTTRSTPGPPTTFLINGDALSPQDPVEPTAMLAEQTYRVISSGMVQAKVDRKQYFPHYQVVFMVHGQAQTLQATLNFDDNGPPDLQSCSLKVTKTAKTKTAHITLKGDFFAQAFSPVSADDNLEITSSYLTGTQEWHIVGVPGKSLQEAVVTLKGANDLDSRQFPISWCQPQ